MSSLADSPANKYQQNNYNQSSCLVIPPLEVLFYIFCMFYWIECDDILLVTFCEWYLIKPSTFLVFEKKISIISAKCGILYGYEQQDFIGVYYAFLVLEIGVFCVTFCTVIYFRYSVENKYYSQSQILVSCSHLAVMMLYHDDYLFQQ